MTYVREVTQTDVFVYISSLSQFAYFLGLFQLVGPLSKQFNAFNAYILLLRVFLTRYANAGAGAGYTFYPHSA